MPRAALSSQGCEKSDLSKPACPARHSNNQFFQRYRFRNLMRARDPRLFSKAGRSCRSCLGRKSDFQNKWRANAAIGIASLARSHCSGCPCQGSGVWAETGQQSSAFDCLDCNLWPHGKASQSRIRVLRCSGQSCHQQTCHCRCSPPTNRVV